MSTLMRENVANTHKRIAQDSAKRWADQKGVISSFVRNFKNPPGGVLDPKYGHLKYKGLCRQVANKHTSTIFVELDDVEQYCKSLLEAPNDELVRNATSKVQLDAAIEDLPADIESNTFRYMKFFLEAFEKEMPERDEDFNKAKSAMASDAVRRWRERMIAQQAESGVAQEALAASMPRQLNNMFDVRFSPRSKASVPLRDVKASHSGGLVTIECLVTRVAPVKPKISIVTYTCETCGCEVFQTIESDNYTPLQECPGERCKANKAAGRMRQSNRTSIFRKFQEIRVQEMSHHVPVGGVPRSILVRCHDDLCRMVLPGDPIALCGIYAPAVLPWVQARKQGTMQQMYIEAHHIQKKKVGYRESSRNESVIEEQIQHALKSGQMYDRAAQSIAPEIFGMVDVKKALLMALVGSFTKTMKDGMKIRGDIHTLLMGDPGMAKSQLLKQVCSIAPRSVYTTGKGSSGVGLTAAVVRDNVTGEVSLEGGALVLADMGVCCIDEFDKMDENDRTAIHEVMEQQSVSIAKAGITVTLNTRTTVLAGANPQFGRYNPHKSPVENINLPPALLSRFDLLFLLLDTVNNETDKNLALHVCKVHSLNNKSSTSEKKGKSMNDDDGDDDDDDDVLGLGFKPFDADFMRAYIRRARSFEPVIDDELQGVIVDSYVSMREEEKRGDHDSRKTYTTPRSLLAILRLSQAHARTRFSDRVERQDFDEAVRLIQASKASVEVAPKKDANPLDVIYDILVDLSRKKEDEDGWVEMSHVVGMASHKAFNEEQVIQAIENWESLTAITRNQDKTMVKFVVPPS